MGHLVLNPMNKYKIRIKKAQYQFVYLRTGFGLAPAATSSEAKKLGGTDAFSSR